MEMTKYYFLDQTNLSCEDFGGEMVAINFDTGKYYGLSETALAIWNLLMRPRTEAELIEALNQQFEAEEHDVAVNTHAFLEILNGENLLIISEVDTAAEQAVKAEKSTFTVPGLEVYSDLQELIMLDPVHDADPEHGWPVRKVES